MLCKLSRCIIRNWSFFGLSTAASGIFWPRCGVAALVLSIRDSGALCNSAPAIIWPNGRLFVLGRTVEGLLPVNCTKIKHDQTIKQKNLRSATAEQIASVCSWHALNYLKRVTTCSLAISNLNFQITTQTSINDNQWTYWKRHEISWNIHTHKNHLARKI